jgi:DNA-binding response OmpR family regulator
MVNILLISNEDAHINDIKTVCSNSGLVLDTCPVFEPVSANLEVYNLIIIDICGLTLEDDGYYQNFFSKVKSSAAVKLLLLEENQSQNALALQGHLFSFDDLLFDGRIRKELYTRISYLLALKIPEKTGNCIIVKDLILNLDKYELSVNGEEVELTFKEYELLKLLLENPDKVFSRNKLLSNVWGYDFYGGSRTVDVHMRRLRSKLSQPYIDMLKTVRNVGYMFSPGN